MVGVRRFSEDHLAQPFRKSVVAPDRPMGPRGLGLLKANLTNEDQGE